MNKNKLFADFPDVSTNEWEEKIKIDLKGADYNKKLVTKTLEGFEINPYYREDDLDDFKYLKSLPGEFPFVRGNKTSENNFLIRQNIFVDNYKEAGKKAKDVINKGVSSIGFILEHKETIAENDFFDLLNDIDFSQTEINFISGVNSVIILKLFEKYISENKIDVSTLRTSLDFDPLGHRTITGKCYVEDNCDELEKTKALFEFADKNIPSMKILSVNASHFRNAGSTAVQEIAMAMAMGSDYLAKASEIEIPIGKLCRKMFFTFGIGSNYFIETAKIRAARLLWAKITEAYGASPDAGKMYIHSVTSDWNKTAYDPFVNILRATSEAMSAITGGTDSLLVNPFNKTYKKADEFSERIAKNISIILKEEAYFDKTIDPAGGAYYIEKLTNSIAEYAWNIFTDIEEEGGYLEAFKKGIVQDLIEITAQQRDMNIAQRKEILLGTNQYPEQSDKLNERLETEPTNKPTKDNFGKERPLQIYRAAEAFEELRLTTEKATKTPKVFLLTYGNVTMRKARAGFAANFFACAGYEIINNTDFETVEKGIEESINKNADITVICSSDDEYPKIVPEIYEKLKDKSIVAVAGYPKNSIEELKKLGVEHFIHVKSNILETLEKLTTE